MADQRRKMKTGTARLLRGPFRGGSECGIIVERLRARFRPPPPPDRSHRSHRNPARLQPDRWRYFPMRSLCLAAPLLVAGSLLAASPAGAAHVHVAPTGHTTAECTCRPATATERLDLTVAPDGWVQDEPRASRSDGTVPFPL